MGDLAATNWMVLTLACLCTYPAFSSYVLLTAVWGHPIGGNDGLDSRVEGVNVIVSMPCLPSSLVSFIFYFRVYLEVYKRFFPCGSSESPHPPSASAGYTPLTLSCSLVKCFTKVHFGERADCHVAIVAFLVFN